MNNKQNSPPIDKLVTMLSKALTVSAQPKTRRKRTRRQKNKRLGTQLSSVVPRDRGLNLTSTQFTATTPLQLFQVGPGTSPGGIRVRGRELISSVSSTAALTGAFQLATSFGQTNTLIGQINPTSFQRLSQYGAIYEYFIFHKLRYIFQSNQPTTATGELLLAVDYDPTDAAPASSAAMMRNVTSTMANIYSDACCEVTKSLSRIPRYETISGLQQAPTEAEQQLQGILYVGFEGVTAASNAILGYILAEYDVELFTPQ